MIPRFDPEKALEIIQRDKVTVFQGVPTMYTAMLHATNERRRTTPRPLRVCMSGGSAMPVEVMRAFEEAFDCKVLEGYGLSETSPVASFNHPDKESKPGSIGTPIEGVEIKLVDDDSNEVHEGEVGEIAIKGHNVMKGYWDREDATQEAIKDGWFFSGDMGKKDEDGYYSIVDRKKELIIRGGYNVYPREIEEVLYEHDAVEQAAVIGVPDDKMGEEVGAAIVLKQGEEVDEDDHARLREERGRRLQVPAPDLVRRRAAEGPDGQDPETRDRGAGAGRGELSVAAPRRPSPQRPEERRATGRGNGKERANGRANGGAAEEGGRRPAGRRAPGSTRCSPTRRRAAFGWSCRAGPIAKAAASLALRPDKVARRTSA